MKKRLLAIMNENGQYLADFKPNLDRILAYRASFDEDFEHALTVDFDSVRSDEENMIKLKKWAETVECDLVVIEMNYTITEFESGIEREEYNSNENIEEVMFRQAINQIFRGGNN